MNLKNLSVIVFILFGIFGVIVAFYLPIRLFPKSNQAVIKVTTIYPGADAKTVFGSVSTTLAKFFRGLPGVDYIQGSSTDSVSTLQLILNPNPDLNRILTEVLAKTQEAKFELPFEAFPPIVEVVKPDSQVADMYISFNSEILKYHEVADYINKNIFPVISSIDGVQKLEIIGGSSPAIRFKSSHIELVKSGLSPLQAQRQVAELAERKPSGYLDLGSARLNFQLSTNVESLPSFVNRPIYGSLNNLKLQDIGEISISPESVDTETRFNGKASVFGGVFVNPTYNALTVLKNVKDKLDSIKKEQELPIEISIPYDTSIFISSSLREITKTLMETILIVCLVIFLFFRNLKSSFIVLISLPLSLLGVLPFLYLLGYSINLLTILAIVLSVGIVVDDSIIILERILTERSKGRSMQVSIRETLIELWKPMLLLNLVLVILFVPFFFNTGLTADLFKEFAFTLSAAMLTSLIVAYTVVPYLTQQLGSLGDLKILNWENAELKYRTILERLLHRKWAPLALILIFSLTYPLVTRLPQKDFLPKEDRSVLLTVVEAPKFISPNRMREILDEWYESVKNTPAVRHVFQLGTLNFMFGGVGLLPYSQRKLTAFDVEKELFKIANSIKSVRLIPINPPPLPSSGTFPLEVAFLSPELSNSVLVVCNHLVQELRKIGIYSFIDCIPKLDKLYGFFEINEAKLAQYAIPTDLFLNELSAVTVDRFVSIMPFGTRSYKVFFNLDLFENLENLKFVSFKHQNRDFKFGSFLSIKHRAELDSVHQIGEYFSAILRAAPVPGFPLGSAIDIAKQRLEELTPKNFRIEFLGDSRQYLRNIQESQKIYFFAGLFIFSLYWLSTRSFVLSFGTIFLSFLFSFWIGNFVNFIGGTTVNFYTGIAILILIGLITKNYTIILFKVFEELKNDKNQNIEEIVIKSSCERLRPILMTSFSTVLGHLPLIFASGAGAVARNSIGITLVFSMIILTVISITVFPTILATALKTLDFRRK